MGVVKMADIKVSSLNFSYPESLNAALSDLSFEIDSGSFVGLLGANASGKTTLLKLLKKEISPFGECQGEISIAGKPQHSYSLVDSASTIGYVFQNPDAQIVTNNVFHELAFGLENLGQRPEIIRRRVAEVANFFGITSWINKDTNELSEGEKQIVNLAAVLSVRPKIVLLDEPIAQLDPIASENFLSLLVKINSELGITLVVATHTLDLFTPYLTQVLWLEKGKLQGNGKLDNYLDYVLSNSDSKLLLPKCVEAAKALKIDYKPYPVTVREVLSRIDTNVNEENFNKITALSNKVTIKKPNTDTKRDFILETKDIWFNYPKESQPTLAGVDFSVAKNSCHALLGGNGSGKSTLLQILAGLRKPKVGKVKVKASVGLLMQNPKALFSKEKIVEEFGKITAQTQDFLTEFGLLPLLERHPFDLSGGEQQLIAFGLLLNQNPEIFLLDEPTKSLDNIAQLKLLNYFNRLIDQGRTIIFSTHDLEFAKLAAHDCSLIFAATIVATEKNEDFFTNNLFYTTITNRIQNVYQNTLDNKTD